MTGIEYQQKLEHAQCTLYGAAAELDRLGLNDCAQKVMRVAEIIYYEATGLMPAPITEGGN